MSDQKTHEYLQALELEIAKDPQLRDCFLRSPGEILRQRGIDLSPEREIHLKDFIDSQLRIPNATVSGAAIRPGGDRAGVEVTVSVGVTF